MTDDELKRLFGSMRQENAAAHSETRRHFEVLTEGTRKDIQLVAESVAFLSEKLARTDEKIDRTAAETQAMIMNRQAIRRAHQGVRIPYALPAFS